MAEYKLETLVVTLYSFHPVAAWMVYFKSRPDLCGWGDTLDEAVARLLQEEAQALRVPPVVTSPVEES